MNVNWDAFVGTLSRQFPDKQFIIDYYATAGNNPSMETIRKIIKSNRYDLVVGPYANATALGEDISGEPFLDNYLQNTLDTLEVGGHIYGIPLPISATSIYYDKDLFQKNGWEVPTSVDDFITLCKTIQAKGITPFSVCMICFTAISVRITGFNFGVLFRRGSFFFVMKQVQNAFGKGIADGSVPLTTEKDVIDAKAIILALQGIREQVAYALCDDTLSAFFTPEVTVQKYIRQMELILSPKKPAAKGERL